MPILPPTSPLPSSLDAVVSNHPISGSGTGGTQFLNSSTSYCAISLFQTRLLIMVTSAGELYFLRETDYVTGQLTPFTKIGIVRDGRGSADRLRDHQTGNPRTLVLHSVITDSTSS